jgi:hypothetical protein
VVSSTRAVANWSIDTGRVAASLSTLAAGDARVESE